MFFTFTIVGHAHCYYVAKYHKHYEVIKVVTVTQQSIHFLTEFVFRRHER